MAEALLQATQQHTAIANNTNSANNSAETFKKRKKNAKIKKARRHRWRNIDGYAAGACPVLYRGRFITGRCYDLRFTENR